MAPAALSAAGDHHVDQMQFAAANCRIVSPQNLVGIGAVSQKTAKLKSLPDRIVRLRGWHGPIGTILRKNSGIVWRARATQWAAARVNSVRRDCRLRRTP